MISTVLIGGDALMAKFKKMGDDAEKEFQDVVEATAYHIHSKSVERLNAMTNTGTGHLKQSMYVETGNGYAEVGNRAEYAGFVEFGTGSHVSVPPEFAGIASKVRSRPRAKFPEALQKIKDWCKRLGIDTKAAYPILMSILRKGLMARPFFYPAYRLGVQYMRKESKEALKRLVSK